MKWFCWTMVSVAIAVAITTLSAPLRATANEPADEGFFQSQVRPILETRCWDCHGEDAQESGLRLDSRAAILSGGHSGKPLVNDAKSGYLLEVIRRTGKVKMPPDEPVPGQELEILAKWVKLGLPWPAEPSGATSSDPASPEDHWLKLRATHWSFRPIQPPPLPAVATSEWTRTGVDQFVLAQLEAHNLQPAPPADRYTQIRRLKFDLLGLPPTYEEAQEFIGDTSPRAYERLVDRYLASPRYGERWGRHWLDVARYADTRGYAFGRERRYPYAYTYRDYVVDALNRDIPFDQFVREQLAADLLPDDGTEHPLAALGFLTVGRRFNRRNLDIDDQIDVVGRGLLGLTVACARCHDHKYDPIPTADYYGLYGIFDSCTEPAELPLIGDPTQTPGYAQFKTELDRRQEALNRYRREVRDKIVETGRRRATDYLVRAITRSPETLLQKMPFLSLRGEELKPRLVQQWRQYLVTHAKADHPVWGPMFLLALMPDEEFASKAAPILAAADALPPGTDPGQLNPLLQAALREHPPANKIMLAKVYGDLLAKVYRESQPGGSKPARAAPEDAALKTPEDAALKTPEDAALKTSEDAALKTSDNAAADDATVSAARRQLLNIIAGPQSPTSIADRDIAGFLSRAENNKYRELQRKIDAWQVDAAGAPPRAMVLADVPQPHNAPILIRGNLARPGKVVPRQFLLAISGRQRRAVTQGSGRLQLADAITRSNNPLTARVIVNRVWMHHFGQPLVATPSDFGLRCPKPPQAELLDHLAATFMADGWSLKRLHRRLVLSATYRQSSRTRGDAAAVDPENQWYWRMNRQRLAFEPMWDAMLAAGNQLDTTMGGRPVKLTATPYPRRRAIYGYIDRQDLPGLYRVFDLGSPDSSCPRRARTTVPQQALFLMNSPFVVERARAIAALPPIKSASDSKHRLQQLYRQVLARDPTPAEQSIAAAFITADSPAKDTPPKLDRWTQLAQILLMSNAFQFVD